MTKPTTCDYVLSKKLYDMGIRIDSYWASDYENDKGLYTVEQLKKNRFVLDDLILPRPMLHELLDVMPKDIEIRDSTDAYISNSREIANFNYDPKGDFYCFYTIDICFSDPNPANAVAKTLIWLVENSYCSIEEVNDKSCSK